MFTKTLMCSVNFVHMSKVSLSQKLNKESAQNISFCIHTVNYLPQKCSKLSLSIHTSKYLRDPGRDISFPIFIRKEIETRKLERKSKQQISRLNDLLYRLNDIISR